MKKSLKRHGPPDIYDKSKYFWLGNTDVYNWLVSG